MQARGLVGRQHPREAGVGMAGIGVAQVDEHRRAQGGPEQPRAEARVVTLGQPGEATLELLAGRRRDQPLDLARVEARAQAHARAQPRRARRVDGELQWRAGVEARARVTKPARVRESVCDRARAVAHAREQGRAPQATSHAQALGSSTNAVVVASSHGPSVGPVARNSVTR